MEWGNWIRARRWKLSRRTPEPGSEGPCLNRARSGPVAFRIKWARLCVAPLLRSTTCGGNSRARIYLGPARSTKCTRLLACYLCCTIERDVS